MHLSSVLYSLAFAALVNAHFSLRYPSPWRKLVEKNLTNLCDGYTTFGVSAIFPLKAGMIRLETFENSNWTVGVTLSTTTSPTSFDNFTTSPNQDRLVVPYFSPGPQYGAGNYCFPIDIASFNINGAQNRDNVTIQVIYDGGDGPLYQCSSLILSDSMTIPSDLTEHCMAINTTVATVTWTTSSAGRTATPFSTTGSLPMAIILILSCVAVIAM